MMQYGLVKAVRFGLLLKRSTLCSVLAFGVMAVSCWDQEARAGELSLLSGVYQSTDSEGARDYKENRISLMGRYGDMVSHSKNLMWYADAGIEMISYSGDQAPDDGTGVVIGGGGRLFFEPMGERLKPYLGLGGSYESSKDVDPVGRERETSGLYYGMHAGARMLMGSLTEFDMADVTVFLDLESTLFKSAIFETTKLKSADPLVEDTKETKTDLYFAGSGFFSEMLIGLGFIF